MLCNKHIGKMQLETAQMLSTAARCHLPEHLLPDNCYKATHRNHPSTVWARTSLGNLLWLSSYVEGMNEEWLYRSASGNVHASYYVSISCCKALLKHWANGLELTDVPLCMPEQYWGGPDKYVPIAEAVPAYRQYYVAEKAGFAKWPTDQVPYWWPCTDN